MGNAPVTVRTATVDDLPVVAEIHIEARAAYWRGAVPDAELEASAERLRTDSYPPAKLAMPDFTLLVAQVDGQVAGFALLGPPHDTTRDPGGTGELWEIHVKPSHWRRGIGSRLHDACVHVWAASGITEGHIEVWEHNNRARAFYSRHGWRVDEPTRPAVNGTTFLRLRLSISDGGATRLQPRLPS
jgi:ribosomal protein S18 acetylase RimI-like enzyme